MKRKFSLRKKLFFVTLLGGFALSAVPALAQQTPFQPVIRNSQQQSRATGYQNQHTVSPNTGARRLNQSQRRSDASLQRTSDRIRASERVQNCPDRGQHQPSYQGSYYPPSYPGPNAPLPTPGTYHVPNPYYGYGYSYGPSGYGYGYGYTPYGNNYYHGGRYHNNGYAPIRR